MRRTALALAAVLTASPVLAKGPPWISVELPANRLNPETRGAYLTVRTYHHATPVQLVMRGTAEGLVNGQRRSVDLVFRHTRETGVFALDRSWDTAGVWVLDIRSFDGHFEMSAVVGVGADGEVTMVRVPMSRVGAPRTVSRGEVETILASLDRGQSPPALRAAGFGPDGLRIVGFRGAMLLFFAASATFFTRLAIRFVRFVRRRRLAAATA